ncbi:S8 family serine peptidase [Actinoplanes sp. DH11]|uniref:S8 family serine peptidase n=1 Tax=Actinoplanes sp. DH11 TaxID=2857011 RepID=UPI001E60333D|nr:S8 family serine peptidase [Actinoplanes sp. DH11]
MSRRLPAVLAGVVLGALAIVPAVPFPASAAPAVPVLARDDNCAEPADVPAEAPWPRTMLALDAVWPFSRGGGVTVAVLSTGVDARHPQLRGRVLPGFDAVTGRGTADSDCTGTGTQIAGVVVAEPTAGNGVVGVAPYARVQPVRVMPDNPFGNTPAAVAPLVRGISWAVANRADVIVVATPVYREDEALRRAVADAVTRGVLVVAATGDTELMGTARVSYPAGYPGVLGVGAIGQNGEMWARSPAGDFVDVVAPGIAVPTVQRSRGLTVVDGTAVAAGYAAGAAAVTRGKRGDLLLTELQQLLVATAGPAPLTAAYGAGVVNPYGALTEQVVPPSARPLPQVQAAPVPDTAAERRRQELALAGAGLVALVVVAVVIATAALRRRVWRPGLAAPLPVIEEPIEPGPPVMLLDDLSGKK